jgi:hypothetical protein
MLLLDPGRSWTQAKMADETELDEGLVSKVVRQQERDGHVTLSLEDDEVRLVDPKLLLDTRREVYDVPKHHINTARTRRDPDRSCSAVSQSSSWLRVSV